MSVADKITEEMLSMACDSEAQHLMRFFKTGKGEYGEGDRFLGVRVPVTRRMVKKYRAEATIADVEALTSSVYHELRLAGFLILLEIYLREKKSGSREKQKEIVDYYLSILERGNNWDLVDLVCYKLLGDWLSANDGRRDILDRLSAMEGCLWHQRVAIVATFGLILCGEYDETFRIASKLMTHPHDLIHKASGWMLREVGKRGGRERLIDYLDRNAAQMPRTMLRYAIEHLSPDERKHYLSQGRNCRS